MPRERSFKYYVADRFYNELYDGIQEFIKENPQNLDLNLYRVQDIDEIYWCPGLNIYHMHGCVKRIDDFYLEENILFQIQQHIMDLGESDKLLQTEKETAAAEAEVLRKKCQAAEKAIEKAKDQRMAEFEAYALGQKKSYDASINEVETLREKHEELMEQLSGEF